MRDITKEIVFNSGITIYNNYQAEMIPTLAILSFADFFSKEYDDEKLYNFLKECCKDDAILFLEKIQTKKKTELEVVKEYIEILSSFGMGEIKLKLYSKSKIIVFFDSRIKEIYSEIRKGKKSLFVEILQTSYLSVLFEFLKKKQISFNIQEKRKISIITLCINEANLTPFQKNKTYPVSQKLKDKEINSLIKNIHSKRLLLKKNGILFLWNTNVMFFPFFFLFNLVEKFENKKDLEKFLTTLGWLQGKTAVEIKKNLFGIREDKLLLFKETIKQTELIGTGKTTLIDSNPNLIKFSFENNIFNYYSNHFSKKTCEIINNYFVNMVKGAYDFGLDKTTKLSKSKNSFFLLKTLSNNIPKLTQYDVQIEEFVNFKNRITYRIR